MNRWVATLLMLVSTAPVLASPQAAIAAAVADATGLAPEVACRTRYLYQPPRDRARLVVAVTWWANGLSREVELARPREVTPELLAVDLDDYAWSDKVWEAQFQTEPYFYYLLRCSHLEVGKIRWSLTPQGCDLAKLVHSQVPIVRADWWLFYSSRQLDLNNKKLKAGYYDWLGVRSQKDFEALRFYDKAKAVTIGDELRGALPRGRSKVAQERQVLWFSTYGDNEMGYWLTLDTDDTGKDNTATGNLADGEFRFKAQEAFIGLPNRLWAVGAFDAKGKVQDTVPDFIAGDKSALHRGNDTRIHPFSCFHCHTDGGLQPVDDWVRSVLVRPQRLDAFKFDDYKRLRRQYFRGLDVQLVKGRAAYAATVKQLVDKTPQELARLHANEYYAYHPRPWTLDDGAEALGVKPPKLLSALKLYFDKRNPDLAGKKRLAVFLGWLAAEAQGVPVSDVEQFFGDLHYIVQRWGQ